MKINREFEREINLKDLFFHILYGWRSCLVAAVIGAILLGVFQYARITIVHNRGELTLEEKQYETAYENYYLKIKTYQQGIETNTERLNKLEEYMNESVWINFNSTQDWVSTNRYYVEMDQEVLDALPEGNTRDPADSVIAAYGYLLMSNLDDAEMEELIGTSKSSYIDEVISIEWDLATNVINIQVIGGTEQYTRDIRTYFVNRLLSYCEPEAQKIGRHQLIPLAEKFYSRTDYALADRQVTLTDQIRDYQDGILNYKDNLAELIDEKEPDRPGTHVKRYAAIGFILGAFFMAFILALKYIFDGKVHSASDLSGAYSLNVYADLPHSRARRPRFCIDKLLRKWEIGHVAASRENIYDSACTLLKNNYAGKRIVLAGTIPAAAVEGVRDELAARLGDAVELSVQPDFLTRCDAATDAKGADIVFLVEEKYVSRIADIARMAEMLVISGAQVGGCIAL